MDADEWQDEQRTRVRRYALDSADSSEFVDDNTWTVTYPQTLVHWVAMMVKLYDNHKTPLEILDCERRYPGLQDDVFTQLGYQNVIKNQMDDE